MACRGDSHDFVLLLLLHLHSPPALLIPSSLCRPGEFCRSRALNLAARCACDDGACRWCHTEHDGATQGSAGGRRGDGAGCEPQDPVHTTRGARPHRPGHTLGHVTTHHSAGDANASGSGSEGAVSRHPRCLAIERLCCRCGPRSPGMSSTRCDAPRLLDRVTAAWSLQSATAGATLAHVWRRVHRVREVALMHWPIDAANPILCADLISRPSADTMRSLAGHMSPRGGWLGP